MDPSLRGLFWMAFKFQSWRIKNGVIIDTNFQTLQVF